jgi:energy-coupling factor transporter ATP-binding protein EcfA2
LSVFDRLDDGVVADWDFLPEQIGNRQPKEDEEDNVFSFSPRQSYKGSVPGSGAINALLPSAILAYTSGATFSWEELFAPRVEATITLPSEPDAEQERPFDWDLAAETRYQKERGLTLPDTTSEETGSGALSVGTASFTTASVAQFMRSDGLDLAFCAVALTQAVEDFNLIRQEGEEAFIKRIERAIEDEKPMQGLRGILNTVDWLYPVSIGLRIRFEPKRFDKEQTEQLVKLYDAATTVLPDPLDQPGRLLLFDLRRPLPGRTAQNTSTAAALAEALAYKDKSEAFAIFRRLQAWRARGLLEDVTISLRKRKLEDMLLFDWLSDGERVFLGRMALLHLIHKQEDALIILDEPETHFNDYWKRQIVDVIDDQLRDNPSEVIISTHSSIALTDVFDTEITLLKKNAEDSSIVSVAPPIQTFGASPTEIMLGIFDAKDVVGQRANEFLDMILKIAAHPEEVESVWSMSGDLADVDDSAAFKSLWRYVGELPHNYESPDRLMSVLRSVRDYTQKETSRDQVSVTDALSVLEKRIGPGYYQFEFRRRLRALNKREPSAPPR